MRVGVPSEIKSDEYRVGLTPTAAREYVSNGSTARVPSGWACALLLGLSACETDGGGLFGQTSDVGVQTFSQANVSVIRREITDPIGGVSYRRTFARNNEAFPVCVGLSYSSKTLIPAKSELKILNSWVVGGSEWELKSAVNGAC